MPTTEEGTIPVEEDKTAAGGGGDIILAAAFDREAGMEVDIVIARAADDVVDGRWGFPAFDGARRWRMANDGADDDGGGGDAFNRSALNRMEVRGMAEAALMVQNWEYYLTIVSTLSTYIHTLTHSKNNAKIVL